MNSASKQKSDTFGFAAVYLTRLGNPIWQSRAFLDSYFSNNTENLAPLVFLHKGYRENESDPALLDIPLAERNRIRQIWINDDGMDLEAYAKACRLIQDYSHLLLLNSHSTILSEDWALNYQNAMIETNGQALIGATGNWHGLTKLDMSFPNPHVRTNAILVERTRYLGAYGKPRLEKTENFKFESGPDSLTRHYILEGDSVFVMDKYGQLFEPADWPASKTYRSENQENLLIGDNKTRRYHYYRKKRKKKFATECWGEQGKSCGGFLMSWVILRIWYKYLYFGYRFRFLSKFRS